MKKAIREAVKISPIDMSKKLYTFVDSAVTMGTAYILAQMKDEKDEKKGYNIISVDSTFFKRAQVQYYQFQAEELFADQGGLLHPQTQGDNHLQQRKE